MNPSVKADDSGFAIRYLEVLDFFQKNGHGQINKRTPGVSKELLGWVKKQRREFRKNNLDPVVAKKLGSTGIFKLKARDKWTSVPKMIALIRQLKTTEGWKIYDPYVPSASLIEDEKKQLLFEKLGRLRMAYIRKVLTAKISAKKPCVVNQEDKLFLERHFLYFQKKTEDANTHTATSRDDTAHYLLRLNTDITETVFQINDDDSRAPLWVPDAIMDNDKINKSNDADRRKWYNGERESSDKHKWRSGCRHYVEGALYRKVPHRVRIIAANAQRNHTLVVKGHTNGLSWESRIYVRQVDSGHQFFDSMSVLGKNLDKTAKGNARTESKDRGCMFAFGKSDGMPLPFKTNIKHGGKKGNLLKDMCEDARDIITTKLVDLVPEIECLEGNDRIAAVGGTRGVSKTIDISKNLGNASHYDMGDASSGVSIWTQLDPSCAVSNWYFILPNMVGTKEDGSVYEGIAIEINHGTMISWDGKLIRHCTAIPRLEPTDAVFGTFFAAKNSNGCLAETDHIVMTSI
jgi:hypothetical protein